MINLLRMLSYLFLQMKGLLLFGKRVYVHGQFHVANPQNISIGSNCSINHGVYLLGFEKIVIGNGVTLSAGAMIIDAGLDVDCLGSCEARSHISSAVFIEDGAWIGAGSIILPGVVVGRNSIVAAGSVVTKSVPPSAMVAGVPASVKRQLNL